MIEIDINSEAGRVLARIMADSETYMVRIEDRTTDRGEFVAIKKNESMWSPALSCVTPHYPPHGERMTETELDALENEERPHDAPNLFTCPDCGEAGLTLEEFDNHGGGMCEDLPYRGGTSDMPYLD